MKKKHPTYEIKQDKETLLWNTYLDSGVVPIATHSSMSEARTQIHNTPTDKSYIIRIYKNYGSKLNSRKSYIKIKPLSFKRSNK